MKSSKVVAIHQPHFCPWLGYFDRMLKADLFVVLDHVQYEHQNYQNRVRIKTHSGFQWITVPLQRDSRSELISRKRVCNVDNNGRRDTQWSRDMFLTIASIYGRAPFFGLYAEDLEEILLTPSEFLVDLDLRLIEFIRDALGIRTPMVRSSDYPVQGQKTELISALCRAVDGDVFLGGLGGSREYLDVETMARDGIEVRWQSFAHPRYLQHPRPGTFIPGLSALDLLFNCGPDASEVLRTGLPPSPGPIKEKVYT